MKLNFKSLFAETILQRGYDYYKEGRVSNLKEVTLRIKQILGENYDSFTWEDENER